LFEVGETSVMVVRGTGGGPPRGQDQKQMMIPFVADYVKSVDRGARRVTVDWKADDA
jgi:ribosomal 30S subunit maturation factor RimM